MVSPIFSEIQMSRREIRRLTQTVPGAEDFPRQFFDHVLTRYRGRVKSQLENLMTEVIGSLKYMNCLGELQLHNDELREAVAHRLRKFVNEHLAPW